jgi:hypothetical protein
MVLPVGAVHVPPFEGEPFNWARGSKAGSPAHTVMRLLTPALGACTTFMVTVLEAAGHGAVLFTVYV